jgi:hypothetical protein
MAGLLVSESGQNTNTPSHTYPHPEREETVADEPPEVQPYKKQGGEPDERRPGEQGRQNQKQRWLERNRGLQLPLT